MAKVKPESPPNRLNRERVLRAAVDLADREGIDALSMRHLSDQLGVVPMALYKHVLDKDDLLNGMVDLLIAEITLPAEFHLANSQSGRPLKKTWKAAVRACILTTRSVLFKHHWARTVIETRTSRSAAVLGYFDSVAQLFVAGGLSPDLTHHAMHALGSRMWGFTQDVFDNPNSTTPPPDPQALAELASRFPTLASVAGAVKHDRESVVGLGCDDQFEFEFALDILLDGIERLHKQKWSSVKP